MNRKIIGITGRTRFDNQIQELVEKQLGARPLYFLWNNKEDLDYFLDMIDGLVLAGGADLSPILFEKDIEDDDFNHYDVKRDFREMYLIKESINRDIPILGICRGHQVLGVYNHLPYSPDIGNTFILHSPKPCGKHEKWSKINEEVVHKIHILPEFKDIYPNETLQNSYHHCAIEWEDDFDYKSKNVEILGTAYLNYGNVFVKPKKIVEFMKSDKQKFISAQWHIELEPDNDLNKIILEQFKEMIG